ncbi:hypothetical protein BsWGS_24790 [Bradybaena similaris]
MSKAFTTFTSEDHLCCVKGIQNIYLRTSSLMCPRHSQHLPHNLVSAVFMTFTTFISQPHLCRVHDIHNIYFRTLPLLCPSSFKFVQMTTITPLQVQLTFQYNCSDNQLNGLLTCYTFHLLKFSFHLIYFAFDLCHTSSTMAPPPPPPTFCFLLFPIFECIDLVKYFTSIFI